MTYESADRFAPLFQPRSIAVIGASATAVTPGNEFIRHSLAMGYDGRIYPLHPKADTIEGLPCRRSFDDIEEVVDYAYIAIGAAAVVPLLEAAGGRIRFAQVMSSGFGEVAAGREREERLLAAARAGGIRVLGPNCLGVHSARGRITFVGGAPTEAGEIGIVSQSGGLAVDMLLRGRIRGLRIDRLATIGNSVDLGMSEIVEGYLADPRIRVLGCYIEDVKDGRRFFEVLRNGRGQKPVVLLVGGQTEQGRQAAKSHTGSLAADDRIWSGLARQTGAVLTQSLQEFLDVLLAFQMLRPRPARPTSQVVLFGNGGGTSVLAADAFSRAGLSVGPLPQTAIAQLEDLRLPPGTSVINPIDAPAGTLRQEDGAVAGRILGIVQEAGKPDAVVMHVNLPVFLTSTDQRVNIVANLVQQALQTRRREAEGAHFVLVLRSDGARATDDRRRQHAAEAQALGIPVYDEMTDAAGALSAIARFERFLSRTAGRG